MPGSGWVGCHDGHSDWGSCAQYRQNNRCFRFDPCFSALPVDGNKNFLSLACRFSNPATLRHPGRKGSHRALGYFQIPLRGRCTITLGACSRRSFRIGSAAVEADHTIKSMRHNRKQSNPEIHHAGSFHLCYETRCCGI